MYLTDKIGDMNANTLLAHDDSAQLWPAPTNFEMAEAYEKALGVRKLRISRGELPRGYKIGFTNRSIWPRYNATAPVWGTVYSSTLSRCEAGSSLGLAGISQPRIEPEVVLTLRAAPRAHCTLVQLFDCLEFMAPGLEIVQCHLENWKFSLPDAVADGSLHARLVVGSQVSIHSLASNAEDACQLLAACKVSLLCDGQLMATGTGANVLGDPLSALLHFVHEIEACPGAPALQAGDVVTTGTWTDAFPIAPGQTWRAEFDAPLSPLTLSLLEQHAF